MESVGNSGPKFVEHCGETAACKDGYTIDERQARNVLMAMNDEPATEST